MDERHADRVRSDTLIQRIEPVSHNVVTSKATNRTTPTPTQPRTRSNQMSTIAASNEQLLQEIREANLAYLVLAQHMIRADKAQALYRLGVSEEVATIIDQLSPAQLMKIAGSNQLILRFRFDDDMVWNLLTSHSKPKSSATGAAVAGLHANIVMAGQLANVTA
jgi:flagellar transcriptional activator FlhD